jgi:hypothetical protein
MARHVVTMHVKLNNAVNITTGQPDLAIGCNSQNSVGPGWWTDEPTVAESDDGMPSLGDDDERTSSARMRRTAVSPTGVQLRPVEATATTNGAAHPSSATTRLARTTTPLRTALKPDDLDLDLGASRGWELRLPAPSIAQLHHIATQPRGTP